MRALFLAALLCLLPAPAWAQFVNDTFTGSDGTALESHTGETGATWTRGTNSELWELSNANRVRSDDGTGTPMHFMYSASGTGATANYTVVGIIRVLANTANPAYLNVFARGSGTADEPNYYSCGRQVTEAVWSLERGNGDGTFTELDTDATGVSAGNDYTVTLTVSGTSITCTITGGITLGPVTDATHTGTGLVGISGGFGTGGTNTDGMHFDTFTATNAASGTGTCGRVLLLGVGGGPC